MDNQVKHENLIEDTVFKIVNEFWNDNELPNEWTCGAIAPMYKKEDNGNANNYRGVTLMDTGYKIYTVVLKEKLKIK